MEKLWIHVDKDNLAFSLEKFIAECKVNDRIDIMVDWGHYSGYLWGISTHPQIGEEAYLILAETELPQQILSDNSLPTTAVAFSQIVKYRNKSKIFATFAENDILNKDGYGRRQATN